MYKKLDSVPISADLILKIIKVCFVLEVDFADISFVD